MKREHVPIPKSLAPVAPLLWMLWELRQHRDVSNCGPDGYAMAGNNLLNYSQVFRKQCSIADRDVEGRLLCLGQHLVMVERALFLGVRSHAHQQTGGVSFFCGAVGVDDPMVAATTGKPWVVFGRGGYHNGRGMKYLFVPTETFRELSTRKDLSDVADGIMGLHVDSQPQFENISVRIILAQSLDYGGAPRGFLCDVNHLSWASRRPLELREGPDGVKEWFCDGGLDLDLPDAHAQFMLVEQ